jgi:hypothetical protein
MMTLQFFVVLFLYPETKGISLEQLQHKLGIDYPTAGQTSETPSQAR